MTITLYWWYVPAAIMIAVLLFFVVWPRNEVSDWPDPRHTTLLILGIIVSVSIIVGHYI